MGGSLSLAWGLNTFRMGKLLLLAVLAVVGPCGIHGSDIDAHTLYKIQHYNLMVQCWGKEVYHKFTGKIQKALEKCGNTPTTPLDLNNRRKRGAPSPADLEAFSATLETTASNMTCVLQEVGYLNADGQLEPKNWSPEAFGAYASTPAGSDPVFLPGLSFGLDICYNIAEGLDNRVLQLNKVRAKYGRQMVFFQCARKMEIEMCYKWQLAAWYKVMGWLVPNWQAMGIANHLEAATYTLRVRNAMRSPAEFAVDKFFFGNPDDMFNY